MRSDEVELLRLKSKIRRRSALTLVNLSLTVNLQFGCNFSPKISQLWLGVEYELSLGVNVHINRINPY
jgi:hypothetical protein